MSLHLFLGWDFHPRHWSILIGEVVEGSRATDLQCFVKEAEDGMGKKEG